MNAKEFNHKNLHCTEDEFNNLLIDLWRLAKNFEDGVKMNVVISKDEIVTFAFVKDGKEIIRYN